MIQSFKADALRHFINNDDRVLNPFFVGRTTILKNIDETVATVLHNRHSQSSLPPAAGLTRLIQGAPGSGKTSLLHKLTVDGHARLQEPLKPENTDRLHAYRVIPLYLSAANDLSNERIEAAMNEAVDTLERNLNINDAPWLRHLRHRLFGLKAGEDVGLDIPPDHVVLLMVDEIQNLPTDRHSRIANLLNSLHGGRAGQPILPVLAGLSNSEDVLGQLGVSRFASRARHNLGRLCREDVVRGTKAFLASFGITGSREAHAHWADAITHRTQGWPKHMHNALAALGDELLVTNGELDEVNPEAVRQRTMALRTEYYRSCFGLFRDRPLLMGDIIARMGHRPQSRDAIEDVLDAMTNDKKQRHPVPTFDDMRRLGIIHEVDTGDIMYECPIPSLRSFAVAQTGPVLHRAIVRGDNLSVHECLTRPEAIKETDAWQRTPLHVAVADDEPIIFRPLLDAGADITARDAWRRTPLHEAAQHDAPKAVSLLHEQGSQPDVMDTDDNTPLHLAAQADAIRAVRALIRLGADPQVRNRRGCMPCDETPHCSESRNLLDAVTP